MPPSDPTGDLVQRLRAFVAEEIGPDVVAAFVYGSVAARRAGPESDIDLFVISAARLRPGTRERIAAAFARLQEELGYLPDPDYPIEIFTVEQCTEALAGSAERHTPALAPNAGGSATAPADSDEAEILRALADHRIEIVPDPRLASLTARARLLRARIGPLDKE